MKIFDISLPPDQLRRKLLLGIPGSIALASPLALLGCGGSDDDAAGGDDSLHDDGREFAGSAEFVTVNVAVELPPGAAVPAGGLAAHTMLGGFATINAGSASMRLAFTGPQLATVYTADALPILFGFVGVELPALSARSTAAALISFAIGTEWTEGSTNRAWIAEVHASDAAARLADVITSALASDIYALAGGNEAIDDALVAAVASLVPGVAPLRAGTGNRAHRLGLTVNPPNASSGVQPILADTVNTVYVQNEKLRRAWYVIRRKGYVGADGVPVADTARPSIAEGLVPMLPGFDSAGSIITSVTDAYYSGNSASLAYSKTPETALPVAPEGARNTAYSVTVLMAGNALLGFDQAALDKLSPAEKKKVDITLFSPEHLGLQTLILDMLVPMFLSWLGGKISDQSAGVGPREYKIKIQTALLGQLLGVLSTSVPAIVAKLKDNKNYPDYGLVGALHDIVSNHLVTFVEVPVPDHQPVTLPALSKFSINMLLLLLKYIAYEKLNVANGEALLNFLEGDANDHGENIYEWSAGKKADGSPNIVQFNKENLAYAGFGVSLKALGTVDLILGNASKVRVVAAMASSKLIETWEVKAIKPNLRLNPNPFVVDPQGGTFPLKAEIVDNDNDAYGVEKGSFRYDWECSALYGDLFKRNGVDGAPQEKNRFSTSNANATVDYLTRAPNPDDSPAETVKCTVYFEPIGNTKPSELIGTVSTTVQFKKAFSLKITPTSTDLGANSSIGITATLNEELPMDAGTRFEWSLASGGGTIGLTGTDPDIRHAYVEYRSPADETMASVKCVAVITLGGREIRTNPVSAAIRVKKGLKTIEIEGNWVYESGVNLLDMPNCFTDAAGGRACSLGYLDDWVVYQIPKIAGALSYTIQLLAADGRERVRYGYPSGAYASSVLDGGGALRIKYWAADGPFGSYNGVSNYSDVEASSRAYLLSRVASDGPRIVATVTLQS